MEMHTSNKKAIYWLGSGHFICDFYTGFINPIMPFIAAKIGFTMAVAAVILAIAQICSNMLQPIFGFFADNILKRFFVFWGLLLVSICIPLSVAAPNIIILTIFLILGCLGSSFFHPQSTGFIKKFSDENYGNNMGVFISLGTLGFGIGPLLAAYITQYAGLDKIIYTSIFGIILALLMFQFVPKLSDKNIVIEHKKFFMTFKEIISNSQMKLLILVAMMKSLITNCSCVLLPFLWKDMNYSASYIGVALFLFILAGAYSSYLSPKIESIWGSKTVIYISLCATFPLMLIFCLLYKTSPIISLIIFTIMGFVTMLAQPIITVWGQKILPKYKSIVAGFINGFCWGIVALCLSFVGTLAQNFGIINVLVVISVIPMLFSYFVKYLQEDVL